MYVFAVCNIMFPQNCLYDCGATVELEEKVKRKVNIISAPDNKDELLEVITEQIQSLPLNSEYALVIQIVQMCTEMHDAILIWHHDTALQHSLIEKVQEVLLQLHNTFMYMYVERILKRADTDCVSYSCVIIFLIWL